MLGWAQHFSKVWIFNLESLECGMIQTDGSERSQKVNDLIKLSRLNKLVCQRGGDDCSANVICYLQ